MRLVARERRVGVAELLLVGARQRRQQRQRRRLDRLSTFGSAAS